MDNHKRNQEIKDHQNSEKENSRTDCRFKAGSICPVCGKGILDYNGMLNVICPACGNEISASFT